jgi:hypothetical protein
MAFAEHLASIMREQRLALRAYSTQRTAPSATGEAMDADCSSGVAAVERPGAGWHERRRPGMQMCCRYPISHVLDAGLHAHGEVSLLRPHRRHHARRRTAAVDATDCCCGSDQLGQEEKGRQPKLRGMGRGIVMELEETPHPAVSPCGTVQVMPAIVASALAAHAVGEELGGA